jgi:hypothetical protein
MKASDLSSQTIFSINQTTTNNGREQILGLPCSGKQFRRHTLGKHLARYNSYVGGGINEFRGPRERYEAIDRVSQ